MGPVVLLRASKRRLATLIRSQGKRQGGPNVRFPTSVASRMNGPGAVGGLDRLGSPDGPDLHLPPWQASRANPEDRSLAASDQQRRYWPETFNRTG